MRFSRFKNYLLLFSPCSCHLALARTAIPSTLSSYNVSSSFLNLSISSLVISLGFSWNLFNASWYLKLSSSSCFLNSCANFLEYAIELVLILNFSLLNPLDHLTSLTVHSLSYPSHLAYLAKKYLVSKNHPCRNRHM